MAAPASAEVTIIFVDTSYLLHKNHPFIKAQIQAIKQYSTVKLKCNPDSRVGLFRMSLYDFGYLLPPTRNLEQIFGYVQGLIGRPPRLGGPVKFIDAVEEVLGFIRLFSPFMKKRLLVFVGSPIYLPVYKVCPLGLSLKEKDIALDVVNFFEAFPQSIPPHFEEYRYAREELAELVTVVNDNDNSHFVDADVGKYSVCDILSKSILKKNLRYLRKKDEKKAKKNVNVKNDKNKATAEYGKELPPSELDAFVNDTENSRKIDHICQKVYFAVSILSRRYRVFQET